MFAASAGRRSTAMSSDSHKFLENGGRTLSTSSVPLSTQLQTPTDTVYTPQGSIPRSIQLVEHSHDQRPLTTMNSTASLPQQSSSSAYDIDNGYDKGLRPGYISTSGVEHRPEVRVQDGEDYEFAERSITRRPGDNSFATYEEHTDGGRMLADNCGNQRSYLSSNIPRSMNDIVSLRNLSNQMTIGFPHGTRNLLAEADPWSTLNRTGALPTDEGMSEELLYALDNVFPQNVYQGLALPNNIPQITIEEGVGDPPDSNPIDTPPSFSTDREFREEETLEGGSSPYVNRRGGRHRSLDSETREHAALVRKSGACWSCMILKQKVVASDMTTCEIR